MNSHPWKKGWIGEILNQAEREVRAWPDWMRQPELRYPENRHMIPKHFPIKPEKMMREK